MRPDPEPGMHPLSPPQAVCIPGSSLPLRDTLGFSWTFSPLPNRLPQGGTATLRTRPGFVGGTASLGPPTPVLRRRQTSRAAVDIRTRREATVVSPVGQHCPQANHTHCPTPLTPPARTHPCPIPLPVGWLHPTLPQQVTPPRGPIPAQAPGKCPRSMWSRHHQGQHPPVLPPRAHPGWSVRLWPARNLNVKPALLHGCVRQFGSIRSESIPGGHQ